MTMRYVIKKNKRRSQRETARLQKQAEALAEANLAMEEDEEIHFNRPETIPDTPRVSRNNTPDPEDEDRGETDYTVVLEISWLPSSWITRTFGLAAIIYAGSAIVKEWHLATCRDW